VHR
ncbi:jg15040, partial [Pararge aegeria aegeria]|jgi:hypothetical protein